MGPAATRRETRLAEKTTPPSSFVNTSKGKRHAWPFELLLAVDLETKTGLVVILRTDHQQTRTNTCLFLLLVGKGPEVGCANCGQSSRGINLDDDGNGGHTFLRFSRHQESNAAYRRNNPEKKNIPPNYIRSIQQHAPISTPASLGLFGRATGSSFSSVTDIAH